VLVVVLVLAFDIYFEDEEENEDEDEQSKCSDSVPMTRPYMLDHFAFDPASSIEYRASAL
jgi:hypothetical protein